MIYIYYIKHKGKVEICMLTVRDDKLNVGGIEVTSSELAKGWDTHGKALGSPMEQLRMEWNMWGTSP